MPHAPYDVLYLVPMLIGYGLVLAIRLIGVPDSCLQDRRIIRDIVRTERAQQHASHASHSPPAPMLPGPTSTTACQPLPAAAPEFTIVLADGTTHTAHVATSAPITDVANTTTVSSAAAAAACKPRPAKPARPTRPAPQQRWKVSPPPPPGSDR